MAGCHWPSLTIPHGFHMVFPPIDSHTQFHRASTHPLSTAHNYPTIHASTHTQAAAAHMTCNFWFGNLPQSCGCFCVSSMHLRICCVCCLCFVGVELSVCFCIFSVCPRVFFVAQRKTNLVPRITFREVWPMGNWVGFKNLGIHRRRAAARTCMGMRKNNTTLFLHSISQIWCCLKQMLFYRYIEWY